MSFHTTIARLREVAANRAQGEEPDTCRVRREDLRIALHVIDRLDSDLRSEGALASSPVADGTLTHRCVNCRAVFQGAGCPSCRLAAPLASAPVAGEAIYQIRRIDAGGWEDVGHERYEQEGRNSVRGVGKRRQRRIVYAAPQASEAVPMHKLAVAALNDLLIDIRAALGLGTTEEDRSILDTIRTLKTQADKDGGDCAKVAGDDGAATKRDTGKDRLSFHIWALVRGMDITLNDSCGYRSPLTQRAWMRWNLPEPAAPGVQTDGGRHA